MTGYPSALGAVLTGELTVAADAAITDINTAGATQVAAVTAAGGALTAAAPVTLVLGRPTGYGN